jgi:hypothetical protein
MFLDLQNEIQENRSIIVPITIKQHYLDKMTIKTMHIVEVSKI